MDEPVLTVAEMRALDEFVINRDDAATTLMGRAGEALADELANFNTIAVVCGPGNNGGDGYAAIYSLQERKLLDDKQVTIFYTKEPKSDESKFFFQKINHENVTFVGSGIVASSNDFDVIVDCLLGTGFSGVPHGDIKDAIAAINNTNAYVISMDINSGVNGDTGNGEIAVKSDLTLSVGYLKVGMLEPCFKKWTKEIKNRNIGYTQGDLEVLEIHETLSRAQSKPSQL